MFVGRKAADYRLYIDNIVIRRAEGPVIEVYRHGRAARSRAENAREGDEVSVRPVPFGTAGSQPAG